MEEEQRLTKHRERFNDYLEDIKRELYFGRIFTWNVQNYSMLPKTSNTTYQSPLIVVGPNDATVWTCKFTPGGKRGEATTYITLRMTESNLLDKDIFGKFRVTCCDVTGNHIIVQTISPFWKFSLASDVILSMHGGVTFDKKLKASNIELQNDELLICIEILLFRNRIILQFAQETYVDQLEALQDIQRELFQNMNYTDTCITCKDKGIYTQKFILGARSKAMEIYFSENPKANNISLPEVRYEVMKDVVHYFYTGIAPNVKDMAPELFLAADRLMMDDLKRYCEDQICAFPEKLDISSGPDYLRIAFSYYSGNQLKQVILRFVKEHLEQIKHMPSWERLTHKDPALVLKVFFYNEA